MDSTSVVDFVVDFYSFFIDPFFSLLRETKLFGVSLYSWFFGLTVINIAVKFANSFFGNNDDK